MKAIVVSPVAAATGGVFVVAGGRRDIEAEEVAEYLGKLRELVPGAPRRRKLSKLELIKRAIQYICELENTLEADNQQRRRYQHVAQHQQQQQQQRQQESAEVQR